MNRVSIIVIIACLVGGLYYFMKPSNMESEGTNETTITTLQPQDNKDDRSRPAEHDIDHSTVTDWRVVSPEDLYNSLHASNWEDKYGASPLAVIGGGSRGCVPSGWDALSDKERVALAKQTDIHGKTTLHYVSAVGQVGNPSSCIKSLLQWGADVNAKSTTEKTPLVYAAQSFNWQAVSLLLKSGAHVNIQDDHGRTALMFAVKLNSKNMIRELLSHGADKYQSTYGSSYSSNMEPGDFTYQNSVNSMDIAQDSNNEEVMALLDE